MNKTTNIRAAAPSKAPTTAPTMEPVSDLLALDWLTESAVMVWPASLTVVGETVRKELRLLLMALAVFTLTGGYKIWCNKHVSNGEYKHYERKGDCETEKTKERNTKHCEIKQEGS